MRNTRRINTVSQSQSQDKVPSLPGQRNNRKKMGGFTLIEVIVSMILVGILAAAGGMAIVQVVQGYMTVKNNATFTQKAQLAMSRITREIVEMTEITDNATANSLPLMNVNRNITIGLDSGKIKVAQVGTLLADGDTLVDNVNAFTLKYYSGTTEFTTWPTTKDITLLTAIDVNLQITRPDGGHLDFLTRVSPRNNKNLGGAAPSTVPPTAVNYGIGNSCFVASAAYGDTEHPMVTLLRDFRDHLLLTWDGGKWLVKQYYIYGPAAARLIQDRPVAMWAVRCLLSPIAALTFFIFYAPWAILFLLLISVIITGALVATGRRIKESFRLSLLQQKGSILIALIGTMVIMATLGAAMIPMFSASTMNQVYADQGRKVYFLAESGFRYAASQFLNASNEATKSEVMTAMNNKTCNLLNNAGSFTTKVSPYWFETQAAAVGATTLSTKAHGTIPTEFTSSSAGQIRVGNNYYSYSSRSNPSATTISFSGLSPSLPTTAAGMDVQPVTQTSNTSLHKTGSLTLSGNGIDTFPTLNGNFILSPTPAGIPGSAVFNYTKRTGTTLSNITLANGNQNEEWTDTATIAAGTNVVLDKFLRLSSTGTLGNSFREVIYNIPVGWMAGGEGWGKAQHNDQFNNDANFFTAQDMGTHITSDGAMKVTAVVDPSGASGLGTFLAGLLGWSSNGFWAFNAFNWGNTNANLAQAWMDAEGFLSYDLQVKVKNTGPYFMAGLGFRMANNTGSVDLYQYGVSFVRARRTRTRWGRNPTSSNPYYQNSDMASALIPASLYPNSPEESSVYSCGGFWGLQKCQDQYSNPAIILWQRTGPATGTGAFKPLAYRILDANDAVSDGVLTGTSPNYRLKDWSSLMVRLIEGYELPFTTGRNDTATSARHLKYSDTIRNLAGTKTARIIGTPIVASGTWAGNSAAGTLMLTNVTGGDFSNGESLYLDGGVANLIYATAGTQESTKSNYIMVYYSVDKTAVAGNTVQTDLTRIGNERDGASFVAGEAWPPDDWTDRTAGLPTADPPGNDYFTLVKWIGSGSTTATATYQFNARNNDGSYDENAGRETSLIVDGDDNTYGRDNNEGHYVTLTGNTCAGANLGTITGVTIAYRGTSNRTSTSGIYQRFVPYFGGSTAGSNFDQSNSDFHGEGSPAWSKEFDITNSANAPGTWSWTDVQNLQLRWITKRPGWGRLNTYAVRITVTYTVTTIDTSPDGQGNVASYVPALAGSDFQWAVIKTDALNSTAWTSSSAATDFAGDAIALSTSGCQQSSATSVCYPGPGAGNTFYDDFGIQLDTKSGIGFLPPIQQ